MFISVLRDGEEEEKWVAGMEGRSERFVKGKGRVGTYQPRRLLTPRPPIRLRLNSLVAYGAGEAGEGEDLLDVDLQQLTSLLIFLRREWKGEVE